MKITEIRTYSPVYPVKDPFSNALRTTRERAFGVVEIITDSGITGWGEGSTVPAKRALDAQVVGRPRVRLTYSGTGTVTHVFAQIVDETRNVVLGNQVTPIPVTLDGASHTISRSLEGVAASLKPGARYHLQLIGGSQVYGPVRGTGAITFSAARIELPTASP